MLWFTDITYLQTWEGWLYLAAVQDAYSRRIVGWQMADHMRAELVVDALQMAVSRRRPEPGLIHHSDQGSQYVALGFGQACAKTGIARSMGSTGVCWDNAVAETFFATLKKELVYRHSWPTRRELRRDLRIHRSVLQPPAPTLHARDALPGRLREPGSRSNFVLSHYLSIKINNNNYPPDASGQLATEPGEVHTDTR